MIVLRREGLIFKCGTYPRQVKRGFVSDEFTRHFSKRRMMSMGLLAAVATLALPAQAMGLPSASAQATRNTFGEVGLLDMPSAHMAPDGTLGVNIGDVGNYQRYTIFFQALPWLDTSFRYSRVSGWDGEVPYYDRSFGAKIRLMSERDGIADIAIGMRDVVGTGVYASEYLVASRQLGPFDATIGLGWGRLSSNETIPNPLGEISPSFNARTPPTGAGNFNLSEYFRGPNAGLFGGLQWTTPIDGLKLTAEYSSDDYKIENEFPHGMKVRSPVNVGLTYQALDSLSVMGGWFYGTTYGFNITLSSDPHTSYPSALRIGPAAPPAALRSDAEHQHAQSALHQNVTQIASNDPNGPWLHVPTPTEHARQELLQAFMSGTRSVRNVDINGRSLMIDARFSDNPEKQCRDFAQIALTTTHGPLDVAMNDSEDPSGRTVICSAGEHLAAVEIPTRQPLSPSQDALVENNIRNGLAAQSLEFAGLSLGPSELWLYYENYRYLNSAEAAGRVARMLMAAAPPDVEVFHLIPSYLGVPQREITVLRSGLERHIAANAILDGSKDLGTVRPAPMQNPAFDRTAESRYPAFNLAFDPKLTQHVFDPDAPIQFMVYGDVTALLQILPGLVLSTEVTGTIWTNYTFTRDAGSALPHVRTDLLQYLKHGKYGISGMELNYRTRLTPNIFVEARGGLLEDMFAGAGGQVIWQPENFNRFTVGADLYHVWQRDYQRLFGLRDYQVTTGHVSLYYHSPWYGMNYAVHYGRYLAGDRGATFEITRHFASGVEIGAWATFTNVPSQTFGEGSFDKGIIIHIPLQWGLPISSQSSYDLHLSSLTRDGGQRLSGDDSLYTVTNENSSGELMEHLDEIVDP